MPSGEPSKDNCHILCASKEREGDTNYGFRSESNEERPADNYSVSLPSGDEACAKCHKDVTRPLDRANTDNKSKEKTKWFSLATRISAWVSEAEPRTSWLLLFFSVLPINSILAMEYSTFGIYYAEYVEYFDEASSLAGLIATVRIGVLCLFSTVNSSIQKRLPTNIVCMFGGGVFVAGQLLNSFAPSIYILYITNGILTGLGFALCFMASQYLIQKHFNRNRALAAGCGNLGFSIGSLIGSNLVTFLIRTFGWRGSMLITGALYLHVIVLGWFFKEPPTLPLAMEIRTRTGDVKTKAVNDKRDIQGAGRHLAGKERPKRGGEGSGQSNTLKISVIMTESIESELDSSEGKAHQPEIRTNAGHVIGTKAAFESGQRQSDPLKDQATLLSRETKRDGITTHGRGHAKPGSPNDENTVSNPKRPVFVDSRVTTGENAKESYPRAIRGKDRLAADRARSGRRSIGAGMKSFASDVFDFGLLKDPGLVTLCFCGTLSKYSVVTLWSHLPRKASVLRMSKADVAFFISMFGVSLAAFRIVITALANLRGVDKLALYGAGVAIGGAANYLSLVHTFTGLSVSSVLSGVHMAMTNTVVFVILVEMLGINQFPKAMALYVIAMCIGEMIAVPLSGHIYDVTHNYDIPFIIAGSLGLASGLVIIVYELAMCSRRTSYQVAHKRNC